MCCKTTFRTAMPGELRDTRIPSRKGKSSLQEDGGSMEQPQLTACSSAAQHSTNQYLLSKLKHCPDSPCGSLTTSLIWRGLQSVPADTPGLCSSFRTLGCTTAGRAQYGSGRQDVCSSWIQKVKFCSKSSTPQKPLLILHLVRGQWVHLEPKELQAVWKKRNTF